jgi:methanogenic corrinoid protein MtbC1
MQWPLSYAPDTALESLRTLTQPLAPVVAEPTGSHLQEFAAVIENVIVPRLLMSHVHRNEGDRRVKAQLGAVGVKDFIDLTMDDEPDAAVNFVQRLLDDGILFQDILLQLMAPAARELGERWLHDSSSFVEVTLGVARMHRILREFDGVPERMWSQTGLNCHALLLPVPGEQHTFGLRLVQEFLLRESWTVTNKAMERVQDLASHVASHFYDVVGLSLSGETLIEAMRSSIATIRVKSQNRHVKVIVGGHIFVERPNLAKTIGADAYAEDAPETVRILNQWARSNVSA